MIKQPLRQHIQKAKITSRSLSRAVYRRVSTLEKPDDHLPSNIGKRFIFKYMPIVKVNLLRHLYTHYCIQSKSHQNAKSIHLRLIIMDVEEIF